MKLEGRIWKSSTSRHWLAEVRDLDLVTEGTSRRDAACMIRDAVESLVNRAGFRVEVEVDRNGHCTVGSNDDAVLVAFMLRALRAREGLSVREVARRLGARSPNAYAQYETGRVAPSIDTLSRLLAALNPAYQPILRVA
jgi:DNA-binding XRE family transcriptional regulator